MSYFEGCLGRLFKARGTYLSVPPVLPMFSVPEANSKQELKGRGWVRVVAKICFHMEKYLSEDCMHLIHNFYYSLKVTLGILATNSY